MKIDFSKKGNDWFECSMGAMTLFNPVVAALVAGFAEIEDWRKCFILAASFFASLLIRLIWVDSRKFNWD